MKPRSLRSSLLAACALALVAGRPNLDAEQNVQPPDDSLMAALLQAEPGTYTVDAGRLIAGGPATPVFVQADALPGPSASLVRVPLAVGVDATTPWGADVRFLRATAGGTGEVTANLRFAGAAGVARQSGETMLAPGEYTMVVAVARRAGGGRWTGTTRLQRLVVPRPTDGIAAGPVVIGERAAASTEADEGRPFVFGPTAITPAALNRFRQSNWIHVGLRISGWKADAQSKPDVTVEYVFEQLFANRPRFFNKTKPQALNAATLGKAFKGGPSGLAAGMAIPLAPFPPGEFRLVVRVTDRRTQAVSVQTTEFVVQS